MNPLAVAERFVSQHFPGASTAVVAGSTARGDRTATSDIDLLLIGDRTFGDERTSLAATYAFEGEILEVFAYTDDDFDQWARRGVDSHRPVLLDMLLRGVAVRDEGLESLRARWRPVVEAGPTTTPQELSLRRYIVTDLLDDLRDATDPIERQVVASLLYERLAELILLAGGRWIAAGKHLPRHLRRLDADRALRLGDPLARGDIREFLTAAEAELERFGGRLQAGFTR
ncbi:nucleotidyltransferase domain-containing protein [Microbacterium phosphatis]|uniref:nucleotidyltransferase domain-containing protein n=1 Tax=Microbacterium phosphatis TaxID=3140248 RepID=UPI0031403A30